METRKTPEFWSFLDATILATLDKWSPLVVKRLESPPNFKDSEDLWLAEIGFSGVFAGVYSVICRPELARALTEGFLGEECVSTEEVCRETVREIANVLAGVLLVESYGDDTGFDLVCSDTLVIKGIPSYISVNRRFSYSIAGHPLLVSFDQGRTDALRDLSSESYSIDEIGLGATEVSSTRVLIVDDVTTTRFLLRKQLEGLGFTQIDEAPDGEAALELIAANRYGLILSDWNMPHLAGIDLVQSVRDQEHDNKNVPFLMITANRSKDHLEEAAFQGVTGFLCKPYTSEVLAERIGAAFRAAALNLPPTKEE